MPNPRDPPPATKLDAWLLEDIQIRKVLHVNDPRGIHSDDRKKKPTNHHRIETIEKEHTAVRLALNLSRQHETDRQAMLEQKKLETSFRDARERREEEEKEEEETWRARDIVEAEEREIEIEIQRGRERARREREWEREREREREREKAAAAAAAALLRRRRAVEEEVYNVRRERVLREQAEREAELKVEREERERARVLREAELAVEREREVLARKKAKELEEAAVARAVEESIITEAARKLVDQEEREKRRAEVVAERMREKEEAKAQEDRLRRRVEGKKGWGWAKGGLDETVGRYGTGFPPMASRVGDVRAFVEEDSRRAPYPPTTGSYSTTYAGGNTGFADPLPEPTWYRQTLPPTTFPRGSSPESDGRTYRRCDRRGEPEALDETEAAAWRNPGKDARRWRETTTERWETVIRRGGEGRDAYRRYKEVTKSTRRFL